MTTVPENSVRPVARTALTWDQVEQYFSPLEILILEMSPY